MRFEYNGITYKIRFQYGKSKDSFGKEVTTTTAFIEQPREQGQPAVVLAAGIAQQCSLDRFDKEVGRKLALSRALRIYPVVASGKAYRKLVWNAYHTRPGGLLSKTVNA